MGSEVGPLTVAAMALFRQPAVWIPCCACGIAFPLLWISPDRRATEGRAA